MSTKHWTTLNMPTLLGKTILVTGGNSGLGFESVKAFAEKGANVILACRNLEKGENAKTKILDIDVKGSIEVLELDLMDLASVKSFANNIKSKYKQLDILLNNAGIMATPYFTTKDGFEAQLGTNHLGHFALTGLLLDLIKSTPNSRVVNVSSMAHKSGLMDFNDLMFENERVFKTFKAYGQSKLANLLFTYELQRYFEKNKINSIAVAAHPGGSNTSLASHLEKKWYFKILSPLLRGIMQSAAKGALPQIRASVDASVKGAEYYGPDGFNEVFGYPVLVESTPASHSLEDAKKLWELSEKLTGVSYN
ncbi:MAG: oxidoreductase [Prolixibacteraceae bacterium]|jgi:NAD(P)-dependent dehydrogenase (short-subunit alcohol dehydrogenase family)|nr:oxidoreductase [Prolixibacteraceae bacterium]